MTTGFTSTASFSENLRIQNAINFIDLVNNQLSNNKVYFTFGKVDPWANDASPEMVHASQYVFREVWRNMIGAKLLVGGEIAHVVPRIDWAANTVYNYYDDRICGDDQFHTNNHFYVVTTDMNVYKCLSNGVSNSVSTVCPTQVFYDRAIEESDGYIWKYLYTISDSDKAKFMTTEYMPVRVPSSDDGTLQWKVIDNAKPGAIEAVIVSNTGSNYTTANTITITIEGDGTGASAVARVNSTSQTISAIVMTATGLDYSRANVTIIDAGAGSGATARATIGIPNGHGSNPIFGLGAYRLMINPRLKYSESDKFPVTNEFRQVALLQNPLSVETGNVADQAVYSQFIKAYVSSGTSQYTNDEYVYQGTSLENATFSGKILEWDSGNNIIKMIYTEGDPTVDILVGETSGATRVIQSVTEKELQPFTGNILYIDNIEPITRSQDQVEDFKILITF